MNFAAITPTIDFFEIIMFATVSIAFPVVLYNLRESWIEVQWALDDADAIMRRLGVQRFFNATLSAIIVFSILVGTLVSFLVPSVLTISEGTLDVVSAILQRLVFMVTAFCICLKAVSDAWWRHDSDSRRKGRPTVEDTIIKAERAVVVATERAERADLARKRGDVQTGVAQEIAQTAQALQEATVILAPTEEQVQEREEHREDHLAERREREAVP